jgi:hypothetical protein
LAVRLDAAAVLRRPAARAAFFACFFAGFRPAAFLAAFGAARFATAGGFFAAGAEGTACCIAAVAPRVTADAVSNAALMPAAMVSTVRVAAFVAASTACSARLPGWGAGRVGLWV